MKRIIPVICSTLVAQLVLSQDWGIDPAHSAAPRTGPPPGLSSHGRLLWNFEALLWKQFGSGGVEGICNWYRDPRTPWNFVNECTPLSDFSTYRYVFAQPHGSAFHLASSYRHYLIFGNYPVPVLIRGRLIACDVHERRFLIDFESGQSLQLGCLHGYRSSVRWPQVVLDRMGRGNANFITRSFNVGERTWALDWTYRCSGRHTAGGGRLSIQAWTKRPRMLWAVESGSGRNVIGEQIFPFYGRFYLRIRATASKEIAASCRWNVWAIKSG